MMICTIEEIKLCNLWQYDSFIPDASLKSAIKAFKSYDILALLTPNKAEGAPPYTVEAYAYVVNSFQPCSFDCCDSIDDGLAAMLEFLYNNTTDSEPLSVWFEGDSDKYDVCGEFWFRK